ncbi:MAG: hypothetical protein GY822_15450 [Deltaproteobacteria bacterium]|nr:hypothetical protein [Deltaproteobacteria bacterium]
MTPVESTVATGIGPSSAAPAGNSTLGKDQFVTLLMTQLANQDPTSPQDSSEFVAQLAQFANVELQQTANANLEALLVAQAANNQISTAALVGKEVVYATDEIYIDDKNSPTLSTKLEGNAQRMRVTITDANGLEQVKTVPGPFRAGNVDIDVEELFEGIDLPPGDYKMKVTAEDNQGKSVDVSTRVRATITGVTFENGYAQLLIGNLRVDLNNVQEILSADAPAYTSDDDRQGAGAPAVSGVTTDVNKDPKPPTPEEERINIAQLNEFRGALLTTPLAERLPAPILQATILGKYQSGS